MTNTTGTLSNINFMSLSKYNSLENISDNELYAVRVDPFKSTLFDFKWADHIIEDISWLRADTFTWQDGAVYSLAYNHLVNDIDGISTTTETIGSYTITYYPCDDGHKVVAADQETTVNNIYTESGVAWYYILDTTNHRFKLPRELPITDKIKGNGITLGLTDGTSNAGLLNDQGGNANTQIFSTAAYGSSIGAGSSSSAAFSGYRNIGVTTDPTKSGIISHRANGNGKLYLYFYIGQFTQSAIEQTAGITTAALNAKADISYVQNLVSSYAYGAAPRDITELADEGMTALRGNGWLNLSESWQNFEELVIVAPSNSPSFAKLTPFRVSTYWLNYCLSQPKGSPIIWSNYGDGYLTASNYNDSSNPSTVNDLYVNGHAYCYLGKVLGINRKSS